MSSNPRYGEIVKSKRTGRRFVVTSAALDKSGPYPKVKVIPEDDYSEYVAAKHYDSFFGHVWEGISPWLVPARDLERTGEMYKKPNTDETIDHWSSCRWGDEAP